jgi:hypothetical protein
MNLREGRQRTILLYPATIALKTIETVFLFARYKAKKQKADKQLVFHLPKFKQ